MEEGFGEQTEEEALVPIEGLYVPEEDDVEGCKPFALGGEG